MKKFISILLLLILAACSGQEARTDIKLKPYDFSYGAYAPLLSEFVKGERIDYASMKQRRAPLDNLVELIGTADLTAVTVQQKLSFYINAYNILTLRSIIDAYPVKSIKDIDGVWDKTRWIVAGDKLTLNEIEHEILRKQFDDPRIHVAVNCASIGCPPLLAAPYYPDSIDVQLTLSSRRFALSTSHNVIDPGNGVAKLSAIFDWFGEDFVKQYFNANSFPGTSEKENAALNFVSQYLDSTSIDDTRNTTFDIEYLDYDWSLNDVE